MTITTATLHQRLGITEGQLSAFCQRWNVAKLAFFGSILTDTFTEDSDVDVLVTYLPNAKRGLLEKLTMQTQFEELVGRKVDLISRKAIESSRNWIRRKHILEAARVFYVA